MNNLIPEIQYLSSEVLLMLDAGLHISIDEFVNKMNDGTIIDYVHNLSPYKNSNVDLDKMDDLRSALKDVDVSSNGGMIKRIETNGLVYFESCLIDILLDKLSNFMLSENI